MDHCERDEYYMRLAIGEAEQGAEAGEIPVGALLVSAEGEILAAAHNLCETHRSPLKHAEMLVLETGSRCKHGWRLSDCTLYVTLEPCPMCAGAILHARVGRIVYGTPDARAGALGGLLDLTAYPLESSPEVLGGVLREDCAALLRRFFHSKRNRDR